MKFRILIVILIASALQNFSYAASLKDAFSDHFLMGTIWHGHALGNNSTNRFLEKEKTITTLEFNAITAENCMKPSFIQPKEGVFTFAQSDEMMAFSEVNDLLVVGHTLVWKNSTPKWFFEDEKGNEVSREVLIERLKTHVQTVVSRYRGRIAYWDVVNEAIETRWLEEKQRYEAFYKPTPWLKIIGPEYIEIAYRAAHKADPSAKLLYNDYNLDQPAKLDFALTMIKDFKLRGVPIYGLGYQGHLFIDEPSMSSIERVLKKSSEARIPLHITELDVSVLPNGWKHRTASVEERLALQKKYNPYPAGVPDEVLVAQAERYKRIFKLFVKYSETIERVTFWGVWDGNSWRDYRPMLGRTDYPLLFGREFERKPAYDAVLDIVLDTAIDAETKK